MAGHEAFPRAVNNPGEIAGHAQFADGHYGGALWRLDGSGTPGNPIDLGDFQPNDINDAGVMAGVKKDLPAIAWFDASDTLQVMPLDDTGMLQGEARAISRIGTRVTGRVYDPANMNYQAFLWAPETGMIALGTLGGTYSDGLGVNDAGQVVGVSETAGGAQKAFLWQNGRMSDLNSLVDTGSSKASLLTADHINEAGSIVGLMRIPRPVSQLHGFLLTPKVK